MNEFIELRSAQSKEPVLVRPESIDGMIPLPQGGCTLYTRGGKHFLVKQSCEQVVYLITEHERQNALAASIDAAQKSATA